MTALKKFYVYLDDGTDVMKVAIPAKTEKDARDYVNGNGDVIAVKDVTNELFIDVVKVSRALEAAGFGKIENDLICRTLQATRIAE